MKEMNRRAFLTLTGAAVAMMALAACGDEPYAPPAPPAVPTGKEAELLTAINKVWKEKFNANLVDHEQLTLNQEAQGAIKIQGGIFEDAKESVHTLTMDDIKKLGDITAWEYTMKQKYELGGAAGVSEPTGEEENMEISLTYKYSCEDAVVQKFVDKILEYSLSRKAEFISIYCPVVQSNTYMIATVFWNKTA